MAYKAKSKNNKHGKAVSSSGRGKLASKSDHLAAEAYNGKADEIVFEEEATIEAQTFQDHIIILYGPPKIGKTKTICKVPGIYVLPTEPGFKSQKVRKSYITNWVTFIAFIKYMEKHPKKVSKVKVWGIDTVDNLAKFCMQFVCGREGIAHPSDQEWGKGWEAYRDEFTHWILRLLALGPGCIFTSHEQEREVISRSIKITKASPSLPKTCYTVLNNLADIILHMSYTGKRSSKGGIQEKRCVYTKPQETRDAGDRTGILPSKIIFEDEAKLVKKIMSYYK